MSIDGHFLIIKQNSQSRIAQEKLAGLEKASAPFEEQIREAGKFVDIDLDKVATVLDYQKYEEKAFKKKCAAGSFHGREEWLLRWLLKKLQSPKDKTPRYIIKFWTGHQGANNCSSESHHYHGTSSAYC